MVLTYNERTLFIENYSAPMRVVTLDQDIFNEYYNFHDFDLVDVISDMFIINKNKIMSYEKWRKSKNIIVEELQSSQFFYWLIEWKSEEGTLLEGDNNIIDTENDNYVYYKAKILSFLNKLEQIDDINLYSITAIRNAMYLASEGTLYDIYDNQDEKIPIFIIKYFIDMIPESELLFSQQEFSFWLKTTMFLFEIVEHDFKEDFKDLMEYHIPFGLSPEVSSKKFEEILSGAKAAAIFPFIDGATEVGKAITNHQWVTAITASATAGGTIIILIGSIYIVEKIIELLSKKKNS